MLVQFVHQRDEHVQPVHLRRVGRERPEPRCGRQHREVVRRLHDPPAQRRRAGPHALRLGEHDPGLIARRRGRVDFRAGLVFVDQRLQADAGLDGRFAVLPRGRHERRAEPPDLDLLVRQQDLPAEDRADDELFPIEQFERLPRILPLAVAQHGREEVDRALGGRPVPAQAARRAVHQIAQVPLAGEANQAAGDDLVPDNRPGVRLDRIGVRLRRPLTPCHAGSPRPGPRHRPARLRP